MWRKDTHKRVCGRLCPGSTTDMRKASTAKSTPAAALCLYTATQHAHLYATRALRFIMALVQPAAVQQAQ